MVERIFYHSNCKHRLQGLLLTYTNFWIWAIRKQWFWALLSLLVLQGMGKRSKQCQSSHDSLTHWPVDTASALKRFSHVLAESFNISSLWSITLVFVILVSHSSFHFLHSSFITSSNLKLLVSFILQEVPQAATGQLTHGILLYILYMTSCTEAILCCFICALLLWCSHHEIESKHSMQNFHIS